MALANWLVLGGVFVGSFWFTWWLADRIDKQERAAIEQEVREKIQKETYEQQLRDQSQQQYPPRW